MENQESAVTPMNTYGEKKELPSVNELLRESWLAFKGSILNLFFISLFSIGFWLVLALVVVLILVILGVGAGVLGGGKFEPQALLAMGGAGIVSLLILVLLGILAMSVLQIASILIIGDYERRPGLGEVIKKSFGLVFPLFLTNLILSFFYVGGFFVFFLPGVFFLILFGFAPFEVIFGGKRFLGAIKGSYRMVTQNLGKVLARGLLYFGVMILVALVLGMPNWIFNLASSSKSSAAVVFLPFQVMWSFFSMIVNLSLGYFYLCYWVTFYKQVKAVTDEEKKISFGWTWIVAIIGWVLAILLSSLIVIGLGKLAQSGVLKKNLEKSLQKQEELKDWEVTSLTEPTLTLTPTPVPIKTWVPTVTPSCDEYNIREGEFSSNNCYSQKDYDDLLYYLRRFNSAVSSYNGAISSMRITCSGSDFFKDACERDKKQKQQSEDDMNKYRETIKGIIARGTPVAS